MQHGISLQSVLYTVGKKNAETSHERLPTSVLREFANRVWRAT
jgi:hypothetical protein